MSRTRQLLNDWMLPGAIVLGIGLYLVYYFTPALHSHERVLHAMVSEGQRLVIATLLFLPCPGVPGGAVPGVIGNNLLYAHRQCKDAP